MIHRSRPHPMISSATAAAKAHPQIWDPPPRPSFADVALGGWNWSFPNQTRRDAFYTRRGAFYADLYSRAWTPVSRMGASPESIGGAFGCGVQDTKRGLPVLVSSLTVSLAATPTAALSASCSPPAWRITNRSPGAAVPSASRALAPSQNGVRLAATICRSPRNAANLPGVRAGATWMMWTGMCAQVLIRLSVPKDRVISHDVNCCPGNSTCPRVTAPEPDFIGVTPGSGSGTRSQSIAMLAGRPRTETRSQWLTGPKYVEVSTEVKGRTARTITTSSVEKTWNRTRIACPGQLDAALERVLRGSLVGDKTDSMGEHQ